MTLKVAGVARPGEQVGRLGSRAGRPVVVEYHFIAPGAVEETLPFYTGTGVWSLAFLRRCWERGQEPPYRVVPHTEPGRPATLRKVERILHELLRYADSAGVVLADRDAEYAVVKRPTGPDSVEVARQALTRQYRNWLDQVGARPDGPVTRLEIAPEFALSVNDLAVALPQGFHYADGMVLE